MFVCRRAFAFGSNLIHLERASTRRVQSNILQCAKSKSTGVDLGFKFTAEEQEKILNTLNSSDPDHLSTFKISQSQITRLKSWRTRKGPFQTLSDILEVEGLGVSLLEKLCFKILCDDEDDDAPAKPVKGLKNLIVPSLTSHQIEDVNTVIGLHLDPIGVSWTKVCRKENALHEWSFFNFQELPKKITSVDLFHMAVHVLNAIPSGDIYVLEAPLNPQNLKQFSPTYSQHLEFSSMLIALINTSEKHNPSCEKHDPSCTPGNDVKYTNKVHYLRHYLTARLFKILVGRERVSSTDTIEKLFDPVKALSLHCTPITMSADKIDTYLSYNPATRHLLGQALLLTITFMDTCVHKNPDTIKVLFPRKRVNAAVKLQIEL